MVAPVASSYSVAAGLPIFGGRSRIGFGAGATLTAVLAGGMLVPNASAFGAGATLAAVVASGAMVQYPSAFGSGATLEAVVAGGALAPYPSAFGMGATLAPVVAGGTIEQPTWRTGLAVGQWVEVTTSNTLASVNPALSATYNRTFPSAHWVSHPSIVTAWNGAAWDEAAKTLWLPLQGGHTDYSGNEPYKIACGVSAPTWVMVRPPSDSLTFTDINMNDAGETTGLYSDGRLRSGHSYNYNIYVPGVGPVISQVAATYSSGSGGKRLCSVLNESTGEAALSVDWSGVTGSGAPYGFAVWDSSRSRIFTCGTETARPYTIVLGDTATARGASPGNIFANYIRGAYCASIDVVVAMSNTSGGAYRAASGWTVFDPSTGTDYHPAITGSFATGFVISGLVGMEWDDVNGRLLLWNQSTNTAQISTLTPGADPYTDAWTAGSIAISGSNTVTPSAAAVSGSGNTTLGRLAFSASLGGCFLLNSTSGPLYFVRTH